MASFYFEILEYDNENVKINLQYINHNLQRMCEEWTIS